jgi:hypothetical protein
VGVHDVGAEIVDEATEAATGPRVGHRRSERPVDVAIAQQRPGCCRNHVGHDTGVTRRRVLGDGGDVHLVPPLRLGRGEVVDMTLESAPDGREEVADVEDPHTSMRSNRYVGVRCTTVKESDRGAAPIRALETLRGPV